MFRAPRARRLVVTLLLVELLDELAGGTLGAALPQLRTDLGLTYGQIGALFAIPAVVGNLIEVPFGVLADRGLRRRLVLGGGVAFTAALVAMAGAPTYAVLLTAFVVYYPASGAFVGLSQAVLVDTDPARGEALMARWTLAGSVGVVAGPLLYATVVALGGGWRLAVALVALLFAFGVAAVSRVSIAEAPHEDEAPRPGWRDLVAAAKQRSVQAAAVLLQLSDLLGDVLTSFLALYLVDEAGLGPGAAALGLAVWAEPGSSATPWPSRSSTASTVAWSCGSVPWSPPASTPRSSSWIRCPPSSRSSPCWAWRPRGGTRCSRPASTPPCPAAAGWRCRSAACRGSCSASCPCRSAWWRSSSAWPR